jgi:hypothetical protein
MPEPHAAGRVTVQTPHAFLFSNYLNADEESPEARINIMTYVRHHEFIDELTSEFDIDKEAFRCYSFESNPLIMDIWENA